MPASGEYNIILFKKFNKLSNEPAQIFTIYHIPPKRTLNCKKIFSPTCLYCNVNV